MHTHGLLLERRPRHAQSTRGHDGEVAVERSNARGCSDAFKFRCGDGSPLRVILDRTVATIGGYTGDMVHDVILQAVENRFDSALKADNEIKWLSHNGSWCIAEETLTFSKKWA
jgi:putative transposase